MVGQRWAGSSQSARGGWPESQVSIGEALAVAARTGNTSLAQTARDAFPLALADAIVDEHGPGHQVAGVATAIR